MIIMQRRPGPLVPAALLQEAADKIVLLCRCKPPSATLYPPSKQTHQKLCRRRIRAANKWLRVHQQRHFFHHEKPLFQYSSHRGHYTLMLFCGWLCRETGALFGFLLVLDFNVRNIEETAGSRPPPRWGADLINPWCFTSMAHGYFCHFTSIAPIFTYLWFSAHVQNKIFQC